ncbi:unnamed protein product [Merluccius merluccius]
MIGYSISGSPPGPPPSSEKHNGNQTNHRRRQEPSEEYLRPRGRRLLIATPTAGAPPISYHVPISIAMEPPRCRALSPEPRRGGSEER